MASYKNDCLCTLEMVLRYDKTLAKIKPAITSFEKVVN